MLTGKGDGTFAAPLVIGIRITIDIGPYSLTAADFNGDGKLDLAVTVSTGATGGLVTMFGRGDGTFQPPTYHAVDV